MYKKVEGNNNNGNNSLVNNLNYSNISQEISNATEVNYENITSLLNSYNTENDTSITKYEITQLWSYDDLDNFFR